jgi:cobalamin synthase
MFAVAISRDVGSIGVAAALTLGSGSFWRRKLGGVTGDTLGASLELAETAILLWRSR